MFSISIKTLKKKPIAIIGHKTFWPCSDQLFAGSLRNKTSGVGGFDFLTNDNPFGPVSGSGSGKRRCRNKYGQYYNCKVDKKLY